jgi:hypothetical protein
MKLYAKIISERDSRAGNKGGNEYLQIELSAFGKIIGYVVLETTIRCCGWCGRFRVSGTVQCEFQDFGRARS